MGTEDLSKPDKLALRHETYGYTNADTVRDSNQIYLTTTGFRTSQRTPGFHTFDFKRKRLMPLPFEYRKREQWMPSGEYRQAHVNYLNGTAKVGNTDYYHYRLVGVGGDGPLCYDSVYFPNFPDKTTARAVNALLSKIKDSKANLAELLAERKKTAQMVGDTAIAFARTLIELRRGNFHKAARHLGVKSGGRASARFNKAFAKDQARAVGSGWLQLKYGWEPLMSDIYGSLEVMASKYEVPMFVTTKARRTQIINYDSLTKVKRTDGLIETKFLRGTRKLTVQYSVTYYKAASPYSQLSKLGVTNPTLLAWELVPYSFVVDWFLPIGQYLDIQDATSGLTFYSGYRTVFGQLSMTARSQLEGVSDYMWYSKDYTDALKEVYVKREVLTGFPAPAPPRFKSPFSVTHMANGIALLTQIFKR